MSKILLCLLLVGCCLVVGACMFVNQPQFGQQSAESSLDAIANSSHYYDGEFHNLTPTSVLSDDSFLDCGQYDKRWPNIHMNPEEAVRAAEDLQAKVLLGRFTIARHPWDEPFIRIAEASRKENIRLLIPQFGEQIFLDNIQTEMSQWWKNTN